MNAAQERGEVATREQKATTVRAPDGAPASHAEIGIPRQRAAGMKRRRGKRRRARRAAAERIAVSRSLPGFGTTEMHPLDDVEGRSASVIRICDKGGAAGAQKRLPAAA